MIVINGNKIILKKGLKEKKKKGVGAGGGGGGEPEVSEMDNQSSSV